MNKYNHYLLIGDGCENCNYTANAFTLLSLPLHKISFRNLMEDEFKEIKTGNGIDRDLAATTNNRLEKTILELRNLTSEVRVLNTNVIRQSKSNDRYSRKLIALTWVLVFFTIFLVIMTGVLIEDGRNTASTQDNIVLNSQFFNIVNTGIIAAMEDNKPILQENR